MPLTLPPESRAHYTWATYAKGVGIILVVLGNALQALDDYDVPVSAGWRLLEQIIYSFHMPLFFFLAGLFVETSLQRGLGAFLVRKSRTLLYPYLLWSVLHEILMGEAWPRHSWGQDLSAMFTHPRLYNHLWFLQVLFWLLVLYGILRRRCSRAQIFWGALLLRVTIKWLAWTSNLLIRLAFNMPYVVLGSLLGPALHRRLQQAQATRLLAIALFAGTGVAACVAAGWHQLPGLSFLTALLGIAATLGAAGWFAARGTARGLHALGQRSLVIYILHLLVIRWLYRFGAAMAGDAAGGLVVSATLLGLCGPLAVAWGIERWGGAWLFRLPERNQGQC